MTQINDFRSRFGLHKIPFTRELSIKDRFRLDYLDQAHDQLRLTLDKRMSAALIAPAGTGKTTLLRTLLDGLSESRYRVHYIKVTDLAKRDLCREICTALLLEPAGNYPTLVRRLQGRLEDAFTTDGLRPVLIFDEAHDFRPDTLGMLRLLTNYDMDSKLVVSLILAGQTPLKNMLLVDKLKPLADRLAHCATLRLLSRDELTGYIHHRCRIAGAKQAPFDSGAIEALYEISRGNMRAADHLALKALELAHDQDAQTLTSNHIAEARALLIY